MRVSLSLWLGTVLSNYKCEEVVNDRWIVRQAGLGPLDERL